VRRSNYLVSLSAKGLDGALQGVLDVAEKRQGTIHTKRSDAGWQEDAESNNEVRLSNSSKAFVVKCEVGARVTRMHITVLKKHILVNVYIVSLKDDDSQQQKEHATKVEEAGRGWLVQPSMSRLIHD
jgi:hypothetical protein